MWRSSLLAALALACLVFAGGCSRVCWPPVVEGGQRLQHVHPMPVLWLPALFRQHEVCWRQPSGEAEKRVFFTGSSGVFGFPYPSAQSVPSRLNSIRAYAGRAHFFNLGHLFSYQIKDAMVIRVALDFEPDLIVHAVTLSDFVHQAPLLYLHGFLSSNLDVVSDFAAEKPAGLSEPLERIKLAYQVDGEWPGPLEPMRQIGRLARMTAEENARWARDLPGVRPLSLAPYVHEPNEISKDGPYDCKALLRDYESWANWQEWNVLEYLAEVRAETGVPVVIVHWPIAHKPRGRCYSARFPKAQLQEFRAWLEEETREFEFLYLDYSSLLPGYDFIDSIHVTTEGQRKIASQLQRDLAPYLD